MSVKTADRSMNHLYPPFRVKLEAVLAETARETGELWVCVETYRSPERQTYLYASGRTRPGKIISWLRVPLLHGAGLAADCIPQQKGYSASMSYFETFRKHYQAYGLGNTAWKKGDRCHVELNDGKVRAQALAWVRAGFKPPSLDPPSAIAVVVDGEPIPDAAAEILSGRAWVTLRPVADSLDLVIAEVTGTGSNRLALLVNDSGEWPIPMTLKAGVGWVRAGDLPASATYIGSEKILLIVRKA